MYNQNRIIIISIGALTLAFDLVVAGTPKIIFSTRITAMPAIGNYSATRNLSANMTAMPRIIVNSWTNDFLVS